LIQSLKSKTIHGFFWSLVDSSANQGIQFLTGIVLARILSPKEFGLIGLITIFITISQVFIDSGLSSALIRKNDCTEKDFSTTFHFNMMISFIAFLLLFIFSKKISLYFEEPELHQMLKVLSFGLVINALAAIHKVHLIKKIDFKKQSKISVIASIISGVIAIVMALKGYGVWSLVCLMLVRYIASTILFWYYVDWRPSWIFSKVSFKELFGFGRNLLLSQLLDMVYRNAFLFIIGKFYSTIQLGYYTRSDQFKSLSSNQLSAVINRVSYPVLSSIRGDRERLSRNFRRLVRGTLLISSMCMLGLAAISEPLVILLIGEQWRPCIWILQLLCLTGVFQPLNALSLRILMVEGRSDLFLKLSVIKKIIAIPLLYLGIHFGIKILILGMLCNSIVALFIHGYWTYKLIDYKMVSQVRDVIPNLFNSIIICSLTYFLGLFLNLPYSIEIIIQIVTATLLFFITNEILKRKSYMEIKKIILDQLVISH